MEHVTTTYRDSDYFVLRHGHTWRYQPLVPLRGMLVLRQTPEIRAELSRHLQLLRVGAKGYPLPGDLRRIDNSAAVALLARQVRDEPDPLRLAYALWLVTLVDKPSPELASAVVERLIKVSAADDIRLFGELCRAATHCGPLARDAASTLSAELVRVTEAELDRQAKPVPDAPAEPSPQDDLEPLLIETLLALGPRGQLEVLRHLASVERRLANPESALEATARKGRASELLPTVLLWLDDNAFEQATVAKIIGRLDRDGQASRKVLRAWQEEPHGAMREEVGKLLEALDYHLPVRPIPRPSPVPLFRGMGMSGMVIPGNGGGTGKTP